MSLDPTFGSFGDIVTLVSLTIEVIKLIRDGVTMRRDLRPFVLFLEGYCQEITCLRLHMESGLLHLLPAEDRQCIHNGVKESKRLMEQFKTYLDGFRSTSRLGAALIQRIRWAVVGKKVIVSLRRDLDYQRGMIQSRLNIANL